MSIGLVPDASPTVISHHDDDGETALKKIIAKLHNGVEEEGEWILYVNLTYKMEVQGFIPSFTRYGFALIYNSGII